MRNCRLGEVCIPSENPQQFVCVSNAEPSLCGRDPQCPAGAVCFHNQCGRWGGPDGGVFLPDDLDGRRTGHAVGVAAYARAAQYWDGSAAP